MQCGGGIDTQKLRVRTCVHARLCGGATQFFHAAIVSKLGSADDAGGRAIAQGCAANGPNWRRIELQGSDQGFPSRTPGWIIKFLDGST